MPEVMACARVVPCVGWVERSGTHDLKARHAIPRSAPIARSAISRSRANRRPPHRVASAMRRSSWCRSTRRIVPACTGTFASSMAACCGVGRCAKARRSIPRTSGSRRMSRTIRSTMPTSRAPSPTTSTARARSSCGIAAPGSRWTIPKPGCARANCKFVLDGKRLHGRFTLVRLKPRPGQRSNQDNWLLIKGHDEAERAGADATSIEQSAPAPKQTRRQARRTAGGRRGPRASCRSARRRSFPRWQTSRPKARTGSTRSSSTDIACCAGSTTARCAW